MAYSNWRESWRWEWGYEETQADSEIWQPTERLVVMVLYVGHQANSI